VVSVARFRSFLRREWDNCGIDWEPEIEVYDAKWERSESIRELTRCKLSLDQFGEILGALEYGYIENFMRRLETRQIETFDKNTHLSTKELERRANAFHEVAALLSEPGGGGEQEDAFKNVDASKSVQEIAKNYETAHSIRTSFVEGWFRPKNLPIRTPGPLRLIGEAIDDGLPELETKQRDRLAAHLYLDFFGDAEVSEELLESTAQKVHDQIKAHRRGKRTDLPEKVRGK